MWLYLEAKKASTLMRTERAEITCVARVILFKAVNRSWGLFRSAVWTANTQLALFPSLLPSAQGNNSYEQHSFGNVTNMTFNTLSIINNLAIGVCNYFTAKIVLISSVFSLLVLTQFSKQVNLEFNTSYSNLFCSYKFLKHLLFTKQLSVPKT